MKMIIKKGREITKKDIFDAVQLDYQTYDDMYFVNIDQCYDWFDINPDIYVMAFNDDKLIGYINFSPVSRETYDLIASGNNIDTFINKDSIVPYVDEKNYYFYFSSIVVKKEYQHQGVAKAMLLELKELITSLAKERDIYFAKGVADAISEGGEHILSKFGFSFLL